jgi:uncharacterized protein YecE (DUF72 family)
MALRELVERVGSVGQSPLPTLDGWASICNAGSRVAVHASSIPFIATKMIHIGTAGWSIPKAVAESFAGEGRHLSRYSKVLDCAEINSSFHRPHARSVYERWARESADGFRFSVKLPKAISHVARLRDVDRALTEFLGQAEGLGAKLAVLLVQLPPSFAYDARVVASFFRTLRRRFQGAIVCEPRHASWFTPKVDEALAGLEVSRAAVDPASHADAEWPGGLAKLVQPGVPCVRYFRWHGSPRMYWSAYSDDWISARARELSRQEDGEVWCIFDNTAGGTALGNALLLRSDLSAFD